MLNPCCWKGRILLPLPPSCCPWLKLARMLLSRKSRHFDLWNFRWGEKRRQRGAATRASWHRGTPASCPQPALHHDAALLHWFCGCHKLWLRLTVKTFELGQRELELTGKGQGARGCCSMLLPVPNWIWVDVVPRPYSQLLLMCWCWIVCEFLHPFALHLKVAENFRMARALYAADTKLCLTLFSWYFRSAVEFSHSYTLCTELCAMAYAACKLAKYLGRKVSKVKYTCKYI